MILETVLFGIVIAVLLAIYCVILFKAAGIIIKILLHMIFGLVMLLIVNLLPFIDVPVNILTLCLLQALEDLLELFCWLFLINRIHLTIFP